MINSNKKFAQVLKNEELLLVKIQETESNLRQYVNLQIETLEETFKKILNNISYNFQNQINDLHEQIWEICLQNGKLIPDLMSKSELEEILKKIDPGKETIYWDQLDLLYSFTQVLPLSQAKHYRGVTIVVLKIPRIIYKPLWKIYKAKSLPHFLKPNLVAKVQIPQYVFYDPASQYVYKVPSFCEHQYNLFWKCKHSLDIRANLGERICDNFSSCESVIESQLEPYTIEQIGISVFITYPPNNEFICSLIMSNVNGDLNRDFEINKNGLKVLYLDQLEAVKCPGRGYKFKVLEPTIKTMRMINVVKEELDDYSKRFHKLEQDYQRNISEDELTKMLKKGFGYLENKIKYDDTLPGQLICLQTGISTENWISILIIGLIAIAILFVMIIVCYIVIACKRGKRRYRARYQYPPRENNG